MRLQIIVLTALFLLTACDKTDTTPSPSQTLVKATTPVEADTVIYRDFVGQITPAKLVEVRSKVTGMVLAEEFREGQIVAAEQVLYRLDTDSLQSQVEQAKGRLRDAEAVLNKAKMDVARFEPLVEKGTISRKEFDDALSAEEQANAEVATAQAQLEQTEIAVRDAVIRSPYQGRIGRSLVNVGALVVANQTVLATVSTTNEARFDFALSERDYLAYFRPYIESHPEGTTNKSIEVELFLADGSAYSEKGHTIFADRELSATTGTFALSALFPNPKEVLRPGMYGRARLAVGIEPNALLVPQQAVQEILGKHFLTLVDANNQVERRLVVMGLRVGTDWIVNDGLIADDMVVIEGHHKIFPGMTVQVEPWQPDSIEQP